MKKNSITFSELVAKGFAALDPKGPTFIIDGKKPTHVFLPYQLYENILEEMEDLEDKLAYYETKDEKTIPFEEFVKNLPFELVKDKADGKDNFDAPLPDDVIDSFYNSKLFPDED